MTTATAMRARFLDALHTGCEGLRELRALPSKAQAFIALDDTPGVEGFVSRHVGHQNVYVAIATRADATSGALGNCRHLGALFADIDFKTTSEAEAHERLARFPLPPSALVHSGGGLHAYWFLREPLDLSGEAENAKALLRRLAHALAADVAAAEAARVLRVPGTYNRKAEYVEPRPVVLELLEPDRRYNVSELDEVLPVEPSPNGYRGARFVMPDDPPAAGEGRNNALYRLVRALRAKNVSAKSIVAAAEAENARFRPPLPDDEFHALLEHALTQGDRPDFAPDAAAAGDGRFNLTDAGNAQRFARDHGRDVRYCYPWHRWLVYDGQRYAVDPGDGVMARAKETARRIYAEAAAESDPDRRRAIAAWAKKSESRDRLTAMLALAQSEPGIPVTPAELDRDGFLLNVENGTLDLRTGELRPHRREDLITKLASVTFDRSARCPEFLRFLERIMAGDRERIAYVQRALGYSLTGDTREQCFFIPWGAGANGKTTLTRTVFQLLGDYAAGTRAETFMVKHGESIPNDVARLMGARFVLASEAEENQRLAESLVKGVTGGDPLTARFMRAEWFDFVPVLKLWLATNHRPVIRGTDHAMWRRVRLIPFMVTIPADEQDKTLMDKLRAEAPGILNWLVEGCRAWLARGLGEPECVRAATGEYRSAMDTLGAFIAERCTVDAEADIAARELYEEYQRWCSAGNEKAISKKAFGLRLTERGFADFRTKHERGWRGIRLRTLLDPEPDAVPAETGMVDPW